MDFRGLQPKLTIGEPGDKYEQEADEVAAQVVQRINTPETPPVSPPQSTPNVQADFETSLNQAKGGGLPLDNAFRAKVEPAMGADFSDVKVHTGSDGDKLSKAIQAKAFTTGKDIFFREGEYEPGSKGGQELLAHELTHVVQQNGNAPNLQCWALPTDWLDYIGLGIDIGERIYIELAFEEGQEKDFKRFVNGLFFAIDATLAVLPGAGGGGIAARSSHRLAVAGYKSLPQSARLKVVNQLAKTMGWSVNRTLQAINVYMNVSESSGGDRDATSNNPVTSNNPAVGPGKLTEDEAAEIQRIVDEFDVEVDVVGSRADGRGRNIYTDLPEGKQPLEGTRSDIDFRIHGQDEIDTGGRLTHQLKEVGGGIGNITSGGLPERPSTPPVIQFRPNQVPTIKN